MAPLKRSVIRRSITMKKIVFITSLFLFIILADFASSFECESWQYEGIPYFRVKTDTLSLHQSASLDSPLMQPVKIKKGSIVSFPNGVKDLIRRRKEFVDASVFKSTDVINTTIILDESIQKTVKPGIFKAVHDGTVNVQNHYGPVKSCAEIGKIKFQSVSSFSFKKGDVIELLLTMGEGQCMLRFKGQVFTHETCLYDVNGLESQAEFTPPQTEWWIGFSADQRKIGWLKMTDNNPTLELIETIK